MPGTPFDGRAQGRQSWAGPFRAPDGNREGRQVLRGEYRLEARSPRSGPGTFESGPGALEGRPRTTRPHPVEGARTGTRYHRRFRSRAFGHEVRPFGRLGPGSARTSTFPLPPAEPSEFETSPSPQSSLLVGGSGTSTPRRGSHFGGGPTVRLGSNLLVSLAPGEQLGRPYRSSGARARTRSGRPHHFLKAVAVSLRSARVWCRGASRV